MKDEKYIKEMKELENEAPTLFSIPKKNNFSVPEGYFDRLPTEISEKISAQPAQSIWEKLGALLAKPQLALASLALLIAVSAVLYFNKVNQLENDRLADIETTFTIDELNDEFIIEDMDEDMIIESLLAMNNDIDLGYDMFDEEEVELYLQDTEYYLIDYWQEL